MTNRFLLKIRCTPVQRCKSVSVRKRIEKEIKLLKLGERERQSKQKKGWRETDRGTNGDKWKQRGRWTERQTGFLDYTNAIYKTTKT